VEGTPAFRGEEFVIQASVKGQEVAAAFCGSRQPKVPMQHIEESLIQSRGVGGGSLGRPSVRSWGGAKRATFPLHQIT